MLEVNDTIVGRTPSTRCEVDTATAEWVSVAAAFAESLIVPPLRLSAFATTPTPEAAESPEATVYEKSSVEVPEPEE